MKKSILIVFLFILAILQAQQGNKGSSADLASSQKTSVTETANIKINIYPVPVTNNTFTIKTDRDITFVKITNIIGQDIFKTKYSEPQQQIRITLDDPQRGMYLVTIFFSDGLRVVKKIMIEESN